MNNKQILLSSVNFNMNNNSKKLNDNKESIEDFQNANNLNISKDFLTLLSSKRDINKSNNNNNDNNDNNNNTQLKKNIIEIQNKYNNLESKYIQLLNEKNNNSLKETESLEHYLKEENNKLKNINNKFEIVLELLISYINEINIYFKMKEIEFLKLNKI